MSAKDAGLPLILAPETLCRRLGDGGLLIVDLRTPEHYALGHVPGAVPMQYAALVEERKPVSGLLPEMSALAAALSAVGLSADRHVVAYDGEGGGRAARLLWTLALLGHRCASLLDGGMRAWSQENFPMQAEPIAAAPTRYAAAARDGVCADKDYILARLGRRDTVIVDTRTPEEYSGAKARAARAGHIPGAVHFNWVRAMDESRNLRLRPAAELRSELTALGVTPDKEVIAYCHTHHRSSHTYVVLKALGFPRVRGYPGSWSEWGNLTDTPVERADTTASR